ncbi:GNAT family N-acetyltransferase [Pseudooceanicola aestuarii]|uniref:GNAT family N-acetyltransferase n=1 Tax=Pseudooceanicola aestuarii TaxID=2697319 RepID=UPI0013D69449|nr:GNAT family N-acetyltransferase [Pseudooceanicola aestuarii]
MHLRRPQVHEAAALTALCLRSKAHWGYDASMMARFREELRVTPDDLARWPARLAEAQGVLLGFAQISLSGDMAELERCFVDPDAMGRGVGRALFDWACAHVRAGGARRLIIVADPGAAGFYRRMGAMLAGEVPSASVPDRVLPRLHMEFRP